MIHMDMAKVSAVHMGDGLLSEAACQGQRQQVILLHIPAAQPRKSHNLQCMQATLQAVVMQADSPAANSLVSSH